MTRALTPDRSFVAQFCLRLARMVFGPGVIQWIATLRTGGDAGAGDPGRS